MNIQEITDKKTWEIFLLSTPQASFLQSWNWGTLQQKLGHKIFRLGLYHDQQLIGTILVTKITARRGTYLHIAYGPNLDFHNQKGFLSLIDYLLKLAKTEKATFLRINPLLENSPENQNLFRENNFRPAPIHQVNPEISWIKDISATEEEIMNNFKKETRYEIRRAQKMNIEISQSLDETALQRFYEIHLDTVKRHNFVPYSYNFLQHQLKVFRADNQISIFEAQYQGKIIASAIIMFYGKEAAYHHAASLTEFKKIPASYLIQWEIIKQAKHRNLQSYNFWGIVENMPHHPWTGLSLFKQKFGGFKKEYLHVQDLPLNKKYYFTWLIEKFERWRKGY